MLKRVLSSLLGLPGIRELHERRLLFPALVAAVVAGVLIHGAVTEENPQGEPPRLELPLPPITAPSLRPSLEKSPLTYQSDYWWQVAEIVRNKLVLIGPGNHPGIMVAPGVALTTARAADEVESEFIPAEGEGEALTVSEQPAVSSPTYRLLGVDTERGVALFAVKQPEGVGNFTLHEFPGLRPGSYVVAVSLLPEDQVEVIPGYVTRFTRRSGEQASQVEFALPFPDSCEAAAIVDLDGELVGVAVKTADGHRVLPADALPALLERLTHGAPCQAIEVSDLDEEARQLLGVKQGVLVERVRAEAFVPEPSIREGDILLGWGGDPVRSAEEFAKLYAAQEPGKLVRYRVIRDGRTVTGGTRMPDRNCRPVEPRLRFYPRLGLHTEWSGDGWLVVRVRPDSPAAQAGLAKGDRIIGVNGRRLRQRDASAFERYENEPQKTALLVRRADRVRVVVVEGVQS